MRYLIAARRGHYGATREPAGNGRPDPARIRSAASALVRASSALVRARLDARADGAAGSG